MQVTQHAVECRSAAAALLVPPSSLPHASVAQIVPPPWYDASLVGQPARKDRGHESLRSRKRHALGAAAVSAGTAG